MPLYRLQVTQGADSAFPADRIVNTLHFDDRLIGSDPQGICEDVLEAWQTHWLTSTVRELRVTAYNVGAPPQYPVATAVANEGQFPVTSANREVALCLSYYNDRNDPRKRGRLFLCPALTSLSVTAPRPSPTLRVKALDLAEALAGIGGIDVDWTVYSRVNAAHNPVNGVWVDDAWDVVRSRGLAPTTRDERMVGS